MAAIAIGDCTVTFYGCEGESKYYKIVTPATADDGDTIDVSTLFHTWCVAFCHGATDKGLMSTADPTAKSIALPGATDNEARTIIAWGA